MPPLTFLFILDLPEKLDPPTDSSLALMRESLRRGGMVWVCTIGEIRLEDGRPLARAREATFPPAGEIFEEGPDQLLDLAAVDVIFMRKDPPADLAYLQTTLLLDRLPPHVLQINPPESLRSHCEKLIPLDLPEVAPPSLVSRDGEAIEAFLARHGRIVLKPLEECSGRGIMVLETGEPGTAPKLREALRDGRQLVAQPFLAEAAGGDKRVLMLGGEILGWTRRVPAPGDFRSNVNAGGHCEPCELTEHDRDICRRMGFWLKARDIHLAGLDLVGPYLLEVNITSPSCLREINRLTGRNLERRILDYVERRVEERGAVPRPDA